MLHARYTVAVRYPPESSEAYSLHRLKDQLVNSGFIDAGVWANASCQVMVWITLNADELELLKTTLKTDAPTAIIDLIRIRVWETAEDNLRFEGDQDIVFVAPGRSTDRLLEHPQTRVFLLASSSNPTAGDPLVTLTGSNGRAWGALYKWLEMQMASKQFHELMEHHDDAIHTMMQQVMNGTT